MSTYDSEATLHKARNDHSYSREHLQCELLAAILEELIMARRDREAQLTVSVPAAAPVIPDWMGGTKKSDTSGSHAHLYGDDNGLKDGT